MIDQSGLVLYGTLAAFASGILFASFVDLNLAFAVWVGLIAWLIWWAGRKNSFTVFAPRLILFSFFILSFALGMARMEVANEGETNPILEQQLGQTVVLEGVIKREPEQRERNVHLYVETEHGLILVMAEKGDWQYGDRVQVSGKLEKPQPFETDLGRVFDYRGYMLARGVSYMIGLATVEKLDSNQGFFVFSYIFTFKQAFMESLERALPSPQVGLGEGVLLGVKRALGEDLEEAFRRTGIIHIVVLSGYNIMIVVAFILYVLRRFLNRRLQIVFGILGIIAFAVMVGLGATVVRASIMAGLLLLAGLAGRTYLALRGLFIAGALMLLWNPHLLAFDVGFQLSFLATLGLILVSPHLQERLNLVPEKFRVREFLIATLATQLSVLPLLLYQMGEFSVMAVIVNVLVLPMVPLAMLLTFLTGMVGFVSLSLSMLIGYAANWSLLYIIVVAEWFGALPFAAFSVPAFPVWMIFVGYALLAIVLWKMSHKPNQLKGWQIVEEGL